MQTVREHMARFDRLEQEALNDALANMALSRKSLVARVLWESPWCSSSWCLRYSSSPARSRVR